ncbi:Transcription factor protein [Gossypium arboreum]|uniref:Transcription factor protein n=1 Tax=Gossypium arboreum TaxID=29729 RepID=A0A0B0PZM3_GOSAR|nr:transcription factor bHLH121 isoform X1 [Gossypium arboreum]XP_052881317.1 transcription factor bHLH121 isoform X1 [Gossypium arboreum]XP_052881318.1 transcription factor bHLH121 isoform X1 [Gossypium arboreum]KHG29974.1 Transcription factor protein [Gossypium arboreum]
MDQLRKDAAFLQSIPSSNPSIIEFRQPPVDPLVPSTTRTQSKSGQRDGEEPKDCITARKLQKADREKSRRDRLNEHFLELGNALDPDRPKNDKATILTDTIQLLKDLTSQVTKLKGEHAMLTEESREQLTVEKNDLKDEKASLKSEIDDLNIQYQQRVRTMFPWASVDYPVVMAPPSYPFPVPMAMPPPGAIPMHPSMQPFPFFGNQNPGVIHNPCSTFVPYMTPNTMVEQQPTQHVTPPAQPSSRSHASGKEDSKNKSSGESKIEKTVDSNDVATDLELKTPGSTADQDLSSGQRKLKKSLRKENSNTEGSYSSRCSSSYSAQDSSSNSVVGGKKADDLDGRND